VGTAKEYSTKRTREHIKRFITIYEMITGNRIDEAYIWDLEQKDNIFPDIDYNVYSSKETHEIINAK